MVFANHVLRVFARTRNCFPAAKSVCGLFQSKGQVLISLSVSRLQHSYDVDEVVPKPKNWFTKLLDSFTFQEEENVHSEEEIKVRKELLEKIQACYYKKPPELPGPDLYNEAFEMLIKYKDWRGVEHLLVLAEKEGVQLEDDMIDKIEDYLLTVKEKRLWYHEK